MPQHRPRGLIVTLFGVLGTLVFAFFALEYIVARLPSVAALPAPWGLSGFFQQIPGWVSLLVTLTIWLGLLGGILLLVREKAAVLIYSFTMLTSAILVVWALLALSDGHVMIDTVRPLHFAGSLFSLTFGFWLYARTAKRSGTI
ncbi:MAG: hypothetical protein ACK4HW_04290 [Roseinatronobacter sp.]